MNRLLAAALILALAGCSNMWNRDSSASAGGRDSTASTAAAEAMGEATPQIAGITQSGGVCYNPDHLNCRLVFNP